MPIKFRCPSCRGRLSIARRKAGTEVVCPSCSSPVVVPVPSPEDVLREVEARLSQESSSSKKTKSGSKADTTSEKAIQLPDRPDSGPASLDHPVLTRSGRHSPPAARPTIDRPLFERDNLDELLEPESKKPSTKPELKLSVRSEERKKAVVARRAAPLPPATLPETPPGFRIAPTMAAFLVMLVLFLMSLSFAAGFLLNGSLR